MIATATTKSAARARLCQRFSRSAAASISGVGSVKARPAATLWISDRISARSESVAPAVTVSGRLPRSRPSMMLPWNMSQISTRISAGTPTQIATKAPW